jgi:hypothetical protein
MIEATFKVLIWEIIHNYICYFHNLGNFDGVLILSSLHLN